MSEYVPTIGLEVHAELKTQTKMFCDCRNDPLEKDPNLNVCPICMGHPGTLPVANREAIMKVVQVGLALGCSIEKHSFFERKNYFYPDLPKGYQISQYQVPFCREGVMEVGPHRKKVRIERVHLEEDAGKLVHDKGDWSQVDFNRAGVPLMELVTHPDLDDPEDVRHFAQELQLLLRYLEASDADMEKGQMRVEVNLSIAPKGAGNYGTKVEVKNINSISAAARAAQYEIERQSTALNTGETIVQETRGWDESKGETVSQRTKEGSADYRYFPEPDLPPIDLTEDEIEALRARLPELPAQRRARFQREYGLPASDVEIMTVFKELGDFFELVMSELKSEDDPISGRPRDYGKLGKIAANWLIVQLQPLLFEAKASPLDTKITPERFADFVVRVASGEVSSAGAQKLLVYLWQTGDSCEHLIREHDLAQVSDAASLNVIVEQVIADNEKIVSDFKAGKEPALKALIGRVMAASKGKANPQIAEKLLREKLSS
ncbi:MAG TPA: Asp-tRNA(Asn)/Glu-tRNA(Gln) amidotransferase subunit GatB [Candidatus Paceibacterota bacterium]|nr:Asp-tRNA(Asn)/Glu-tRNA(Gln) amidotransferase subunit GatB [Candidatus Paceibacterota bacterium]